MADIPEDKFVSRQKIMRAERQMLELGMTERGALLTPILLDIRELLQKLADSLNLKKETSS